MTGRTAAVVPAHDGRAWLPGCLRALSGQEGARFDVVVVVDDASRDGTADWVAEAHPSVLLVRRAVRGGFARAANAGLRAAAAAGCAHAALVNSDVELDPGWLACARAELAPERAAVATKMVALADPGVLDDCGDVLRRDGVCEQRGRGRRDSGQLDLPGEVWGACAGAALYRLEPVLALGGFDELYGQYLEDADLALRLRLAGWRCGYAPAVARHAGGGSAAALPAPVRYWTARNTVLLVATWFPAAWWRPVAYRQLAWLAAAARTGALGPHLRGVRDGLLAARRLGRLRGRARRRAAWPVPIEAAVPDRPWRGPRAGGHARSPV